MKQEVREINERLEKVKVCLRTSREKTCEQTFCEEGNAKKMFTLSCCLLIKSSLLNYVPCRRYGDFNLSELISLLSTGGWSIMQRTVMRLNTY